MDQFDETFFECKLIGGEKHTDIIRVEATILKGNQKGQGLQLQCKWFNITRSNDFREIEGVTGAFYQPCLEDVDTKIMVQAAPVLDNQEYLGMPVVMETGYLLQDIIIQETVNSSFQKDGFIETQCKCENSSIRELHQSCEILMTVQMQQISILNHSNNTIIEFPITETFPQMKMIKRTDNQAEILLDEEKSIAIRFLNNLSRDVMYLILKTLRGKAKLNQSITQETNLNNSAFAELYAKVADYASLIEKQDIEIKKLQKELEQEKQKQKEQKLFLSQLKKEFDLQSVQLTEQKNKFDQNNQQMEKQTAKIKFFEQEVKLLKTQLITLENQNKKLTNKYQEIERQQQLKSDEIKEMIYKEREEMLIQQIKNLKEENGSLRVLNDNINTNFQQQEQINDKLQQENEGLQNEINSMKRKYKSMALEQSALLKQQQSQHQSNQSSPKSERPSSKILFQTNDFQIDYQEKDEEIKKLRYQIGNLESTIKSLNIAYANDMRNKDGRKQTITNSNTKEIQLQKLANSLAETVGEKDMALENQRKINRDLMNRIKELEMKQQQNN